VAGRQELRVAEGARARPPDGERIDTHPSRNLERGQHLWVERGLQVARPLPYPLLVARVTVAALQAALEVLGLLGHGEPGEPIEDHAAAGVAAAVGLDRDDGGTHAGGDAEAPLRALEGRCVLDAAIPGELRPSLAEEVAVHEVRLAAAGGGDWK